MKLKLIIKLTIRFLLHKANLEYLLEYWQIRKNENSQRTRIVAFYHKFMKPGLRLLDVEGEEMKYAEDSPKEILQKITTFIHAEQNFHKKGFLENGLNTLSLRTCLLLSSPIKLQRNLPTLSASLSSK